ncbi:hypothetical protein C3L33_06230, partial [Rhododendron williamsianum]
MFVVSIVRQSLAKALSKSSKEYETLLKTETDKFKAVYEKICKEKAAHLQAFKVNSSKGLRSFVLLFLLNKLVADLEALPGLAVHCVSFLVRWFTGCQKYMMPGLVQ